jgi:hypothetical protein
MRILMISAEGPPLARATALVDVLDARANTRSGS